MPRFISKCGAKRNVIINGGDICKIYQIDGTYKQIKYFKNEKWFEQSVNSELIGNFNFWTCFIEVTIQIIWNR